MIRPGMPRLAPMAPLVSVPPASYSPARLPHRQEPPASPADARSPPPSARQTQMSPRITLQPSSPTPRTLPFSPNVSGIGLSPAARSSSRFFAASPGQMAMSPKERLDYSMSYDIGLSGTSRAKRGVEPTPYESPLRKGGSCLNSAAPMRLRDYRSPLTRKPPLARVSASPRLGGTGHGLSPALSPRGEWYHRR